MKATWPRVRLGEVLKRSDEIVALQPDAEYREITVRLWGKGVVQRGIVTGAAVAAQRRFVARQGQFILSRIDSRNGALGIVPPELDGAIVTNDFPLFGLNEDRLLPAYLGWMCRTASFVEQCQRVSEGTTNRVRLQEDKFLTREIPLPPLAEQRRVVARIEQLAAQIHEARALRQQAAEEVEALCRSIISHDAEAMPTPMRELVRLRSPDVIVSPNETYQFAGVYCFGRGVFRGQMKLGMDFAYPRLTRLKTGNFVYPKLMAWRGRLALCPLSAMASLFPQSSRCSRLSKNVFCQRYWTPTFERRPFGQSPAPERTATLGNPQLSSPETMSQLLLTVTAEP
jgi:type I restriction enzyme S subunit